MEGLDGQFLVKSHQVLTALLESCWDIFFPYLLNEDIGKLDSALTDKSLRKIYAKHLSKFYLINNIYSPSELEWIIKRGIDLTVCLLDFDEEGKI